MNILYFGTVCDLKSYDSLLSDCSLKPSVAPIVFESSLLTGLKQNGVKVDVYSFPMIPAFPKFKKICWGSKKETLDCGYECTWLKTINIPILKQLSRRLDARRVLKKWLKQNLNEDSVVMSYSIPPFLVKDITRLSKKYGVKSVATVTDLLRDMYINANDNRNVMALKNIYIGKAMAYQTSYDGYIYLTEHMREAITSEKPYVVMEAIADISLDNTVQNIYRATPPAIMYAGMIEEKYGIINLIEAFEKADIGNTELWLFGSGNASEKVLERAEKNKKIRFFGRLNREKVIEYEKKASLLVNPRNANDEYTKYSFPSKTIEYMLSGTPVLTTRLEGIPKEYFRYLYVCDNNECECLKKAFEDILSSTADELSLFGMCAKMYVTENKNPKKQGERIVSFLEEVLKS